MTERIYYTDPSCRAFGAVVSRAFSHEGRHAVVLDRTAFYPTSGGQPYDTGWLDEVDVLETIDADDEIVHIVSAPIAAGTRVRGEVDWTRRADHMQQHTGQHVLSAAFERLFENRTASFHMGDQLATIDLARQLSSADVERAVDEANQIVWDDRPVSIRFVSEDDAASLPLRKTSPRADSVTNESNVPGSPLEMSSPAERGKRERAAAKRSLHRPAISRVEAELHCAPARRGRLRLIEIEDFDLSACGGTHVSRTGPIGTIAVLGTERFKGGMRVTFACGARALRALRTYRDAVTGSVRLLSVLPRELPAAIERLQGDARDMRKRIDRLQESLAGHEAAKLLAAADVAGETRVIVETLDGWDAQGLKAIALALTGPSEAGHHAVAPAGAGLGDGRTIRAALFSRTSPAFVVVACSGGCDAAAVLRALTTRFGGRGGGKAGLAQGGGLSGSPGEMTALVRTLLV